MGKAHYLLNIDVDVGGTPADCMMRLNWAACRSRSPSSSIAAISRRSDAREESQARSSGGSRSSSAADSASALKSFSVVLEKKIGASLFCAMKICRPRRLCVDWYQFIQ